jgi:hypothetical protein
MIPCIIMDVYFICWQPYLYFWEFILHIISIVIEGIFFIFTLVLLILFILKK